MEKDYRLEVKVKNNLLHKAMLNNGLFTNADLARASGLDHSTVGRMMNLKVPLYDDYGNMRVCWRRTSEVLKTLPEDLIPKKHHNKGLKSNKASTEVDFTFVESMIAKNPDELMIEHKMQDAVHEMLDTIPLRHATVLQMRFGLDGREPMELSEVGDVFGVSKERVRQIEAKALRMLKHPDRSGKLRPFVSEA